MPDHGAEQHAAPAMGLPLLITKLRPPTLGRGIVQRQPLLETLRQGFDGPLTLLTAPAGYGKTTGLVAALAHYDHPWGWLVLDQHDDDLHAFMELVVRAIQTSYPEAGRTTRSLLYQQRRASPDLLARTLTNELAALPHGYLLVLDDFDVIQDPLVLAFLDALLHHPTTDLRLAIASRERPGLALTRLRSRGMVTAIDANRLRFTFSETQTFLEQMLEAPPPEAVVAALHAQTEGWPAGLRLLTVAALDQHEPEHFLSTTRDANLEGVQEFLWTEILSRQSAAMQSFLFQTAMFDRVCTELAWTAMAYPPPREECQELLQKLARTNLFVTELDDQGIWYRYHSLFRTVLRRHLVHQMNADERAALNKRASAWFASRGLIEEAVGCALESGAIDIASHLIETHATDVFNREQWPRMERWLRRLPPEAVRHRPGLLIARAWISQLRAQYGEIEPFLASAQTLLSQTPHSEDVAASYDGQIDALRGGALILSGSLRAGFDKVHSAWARLPDEQAFPRRVALSYMAIAGQALGKGASLQELLEVEAANFEEGLVYAEGLIFAAAYHQLAEGALYSAEALLPSLLGASDEQGLRLSSAWANFFLGRIWYEWDNLDLAESHFRAVIKNRDHAHFLPLQGSLFGLALTLLAKGDAHLAANHVESFTEAATQTWNPQFLGPLRSLRARLALRQDDLATALRWASPSQGAPLFTPVFAVEVPNLTYAWAQIALGTPPAVAAALASLEILEESFTEWHDALHLVHVLALQALALHRLGQPAPALAVLERAVHLAAPGGMVRTFLDLGAPMAQLMADLAVASGSTSHGGRLQVAFTQDGAARAATSLHSASVDLVEQLTAREFEILHLFQRRLSDREIAAALRISRETVHTHSTNIYQKLSVGRRQDAVRRAQELGLLANHEDHDHQDRSV